MSFEFLLLLMVEVRMSTMLREEGVREPEGEGIMHRGMMSSTTIRAKAIRLLGMAVHGAWKEHAGVSEEFTLDFGEKVLRRLEKGLWAGPWMIRT